MRRPRKERRKPDMERVGKLLLTEHARSDTLEE
ncbi:MAG: hypothetical protein JWR83_1254 [Aeromicrobium sp.]|nr:hypothetical protein [Aeromicrobium sp.]